MTTEMLKLWMMKQEDENSLADAHTISRTSVTATPLSRLTAHLKSRRESVRGGSSGVKEGTAAWLMSQQSVYRHKI